MRATLLLLAIGTSHADTLRMRRVDATNLHMADHEGARSWHVDYAITLDLAAKTKAVVTSRGTRRDHDMFVFDNRTHNIDERFTWTTTWRGSWSIKANALALTLDLEKHECKGVKDDNGAKTPLPCRPASAKASLACTLDAVALEDRAANKSAKSAAWRCSPAAGTELGESTIWVFAKAGCIEVNGGNMTSLSYARCSSP